MDLLRLCMMVSKLSLKENIINTKKVIEIAHKKNISVEGELGYLNNEDGTGKIILKYTMK